MQPLKPPPTNNLQDQIAKSWNKKGEPAGVDHLTQWAWWAHAATWPLWVHTSLGGHNQHNQTHALFLLIGLWVNVFLIKNWVWVGAHLINPILLRVQPINALSGEEISWTILKLLGFPLILCLFFFFGKSHSLTHLMLNVPLTFSEVSKK